MFLKDSDLTSKPQTDEFSLPTSQLPLGPFEKALSGKTENIFDEARSDFIHRYGRAQHEPDLVRAYLRQDKTQEPNPVSALSLKAFGLKESPGDPLLEARLLDKKLPPVKGVRDRSEYAQSLLAELIEHPLLNADIAGVLDLDESERLARIQELEKFYGKTVQELMAFMEFKRARREIEEVSRQGAEQLGKGHGPGLVPESVRAQLEYFENGGLERFFDAKPKAETNDAKPFVELEKLDQEKIELIKEEQRLEASSLYDMGKDFTEPLEHDPEEGEFQFRTYAYDRPRYYQDARRNIYGQNYVDNEWIPERNKIFAKDLQHRPNPEISANEKRTERLPELKLSELMNRLKSGNETEEECREIYKEIHRKLDSMARLPKKDKHLVDDGPGKGKRFRQDGWVLQEMIRRRIALDSNKFWSIDAIKRKGAFAQLDGYKAGVALEEQTAVGSLHWGENHELSSAQNRLKSKEFRRNLKRRIEEYLKETTLSDLSKRKELFLAIEKASTKNEFPAEELTQGQFMALLTHPFSLEFSGVLCHENVMDRVQIKAPELLESFIKLVKSAAPGPRAVYTDFFRVFDKAAVNDETASQISQLLEIVERENRITGATCFWLKRLLAANTLQSLQQTSLAHGKPQTILRRLNQLLGSLAELTIQSRETLNLPVLAANITESAPKSLFFAHLWTASGSSQGIRLILLANAVWNSAERGDDVALLMLQFSSTFPISDLQRVFADNMSAAMRKAGLDAAANRVNRGFGMCEGLVERAQADDIFEFESDKEPSLVHRMFFDVDSKCFVAGGRPMMKDLRRPLRDLNSPLFEKLRSVIECSPLSRKLRDYENLHTFYKRRQGNSLPNIEDGVGGISLQTMHSNLAIMGDFYSINVKRKVIDEDFDDNQRARTSGIKFKLEDKGFGRRPAVKRYFSKVPYEGGVQDIRRSVKRNFSENSDEEKLDSLIRNSNFHSDEELDPIEQIIETSNQDQQKMRNSEKENPKSSFPRENMSLWSSWNSKQSKRNQESQIHNQNLNEDQIDYLESRDVNNEEQAMEFVEIAIGLESLHDNKMKRERKNTSKSFSKYKNYDTSKDLDQNNETIERERKFKYDFEFFANSNGGKLYNLQNCQEEQLSKHMNLEIEVSLKSLQQSFQDLNVSETFHQIVNEISILERAKKSSISMLISLSDSYSNLLKEDRVILQRLFKMGKLSEFQNLILSNKRNDYLSNLNKNSLLLFKNLAKSDFFFDLDSLNYLIAIKQKESELKEPIYERTDTNEIIIMKRQISNLENQIHKVTASFFLNHIDWVLEDYLNSEGHSLGDDSNVSIPELLKEEKYTIHLIPEMIQGALVEKIEKLQQIVYSDDSEDIEHDSEDELDMKDEEMDQEELDFLGEQDMDIDLSQTIKSETVSNIIEQMTDEFNLYLNSRSFRKK